MNRIKLVVCDIDGTLVQKELHLFPETVKCIEKLRENGIEFTLATGRMPYRAQLFAEDAKLRVPFVANNGSILCQDESFIFCKKVKAEIFRDVLRPYMMSVPDLTVIFSYDDRERPVLQTDWIRARLHKYKGYDETLGDNDDTWQQEVHKLYVIDDARTGVIGEIADKLRKINGGFSFFQYQQYSMEIVAEGCSKAEGLQRLFEYVNVKPEEVMAIGDHTNDMEIISMVGVGVAVGNAQPELKAIADIVTQGECHLGVEEAINNLISSIEA